MAFLHRPSFSCLQQELQVLVDRLDLRDPAAPVVHAQLTSPRSQGRQSGVVVALNGHHANLAALPDLEALEADGSVLLAVAAAVLTVAPAAHGDSSGSASNVRAAFPKRAGPLKSPPPPGVYLSIL